MDLLAPFVIGSSVVSTGFTLSYLGKAHYEARHKGRTVRFPYEYAVIAVIILFGLFNIINVKLQKTMDHSKRVYIPYLVGGLLGLLFSVIGRYQYKLPTRIFGVKPRHEWSVHIIATFIYAVIFGVVVEWLNKKFRI